MRLLNKRTLKSTTDRKSTFRILSSSLVPLFILAHFGGHITGAMLKPLMPMIRTDLGLNYTQAGIVFSAFSITRGISQLPGGWLADRFGTQLLVTISVVGVAVGGLFVGLFSQSYLVLVILLIVAAMLGGGYHPAATAAISTTVPPEYRGRAFGFHMIGGSSAFWIIPLIATPIAITWGWRSSYIILAIPAFIIGILLYIFIGKRIQTQSTEQKNSNSKTSVTKVRVNWRKLLPFLVISITTGTMIQSVAAYFSLYAVDQLGIAVTTAALLMAVRPAVGLFAGPFGGYLSDRIGSVPVIIVVSFLAIPLIYLIGVVPNMLAFIAVMIVSGIFSYTRGAASEAYIVGYTPEYRRSTILGIYFFANAEISGLLTPVIGILIDWIGFSSSFTVVSITLAVIVLISSIFIWRGRGQTDERC